MTVPRYNSRQLKIALFDLDDVIVFKKTNAGEALHKKYGIRMTDMTEFFNERFLLFKTGKADLRRELSMKLVDWGCSVTIDDVLRFWFETENTNIDERVLDRVDELRVHHIRFFISSDQEKYRGEALWSQLGDHFDGHFFSYEVGYTKTHPEYWRSVLTDLAIEPGEIIYWDDNAANIDEARKHGINAKLFTTYDTFLKQWQDDLVLQSQA